MSVMMTAISARRRFCLSLTSCLLLCVVVALAHADEGAECQAGGGPCKEHAYGTGDNLVHLTDSLFWTFWYFSRSLGATMFLNAEVSSVSL